MTNQPEINWREHAKRAEAELARLRKARDADGEFQSEIVSDAKDPSVNVPWMRCSPDLPKYVRGLEAACAEMRRAIRHAITRIDEGTTSLLREDGIIDYALSSDCGKEWLAPEKAGKLREALSKIAGQSGDSWARAIAMQALEDTK